MVFQKEDDCIYQISFFFRFINLFFFLCLFIWIAWNTKYPGFGGYMPWVKVGETDISLLPEWSDRVPSLDNGEWIWGIYAVSKVCQKMKLTGLARDYMDYFNLLAAVCLLDQF